MAQGISIPRTAAPLPRRRAAARSGRSPGLSFAARSWNRYTDENRIRQWDDLARWAATPNPFYESWYLLPSLRQLDPRGEVELLVLRADGKLAGLMPVLRARDYYGHRLPHLANWTHPNCFLGQPLVAPGFEAMFWQETLAWADRNAGTGLFFHLSHMPMDGPLHRTLAEACAGTRAAATVMREERAALRPAPGTDPETYLAQALSTKKRKELRRQHRRLEELGDMQVERRSDALGVDRWAREFLRLEAGGWKGEAGSALASDDANARLFIEALKGAAQRGRLERVALRLGKRPIAMLVNFLTAPGGCSYKTAYDEDYARFSPGVLLQIDNLAMLGNPAIDWVDSCAVEGHPMIDHLWRERRAIGRHSIGIGGTVRQAIFKAIAKRETGAPPGGIA